MTLVTSSATHGTYDADANVVDEFADRYFGDVNSNRVALRALVIECTGFGDNNYWLDLSNVEMFVVLAYLGITPSRMTEWFVEYDYSVVI